MGCCASNIEQPPLPKIELLEEEKKIQQQEKTMLFFDKYSKEVELQLKSKSTKDKLSTPQLRRVAFHLKIDSSVFQDPSKPEFKFLNLFRSEGSLYDVSVLSLYGIMIGQGTVEEKASILFDHFDADASGMMNKEEIRQMLEKMIEISVDKVPQITIIQNVLTEEAKESYVKLLLSAKDSFIGSLTEKITGEGEEINLEGFIQKIKASEDLKNILWAKGMRTALFYEAKKLGNSSVSN